MVAEPASPTVSGPRAAPPASGSRQSTKKTWRFTVAKASAVLVAALACILALPGLASAAFVPPPLLSQATANPAGTLNVIVLGQPTTTSAALRDRVKNAGGKNLVPFSVIRGMVVNLTGAQLSSLASDPTIRSITPNGRIKGQSVASGYLWPQATGVNTLWSTPLSPAPNAPGIAFVDSGIDTSRWQDFGKRIQAALDFTGATGPSGRDDNGHGTMVAGIAAGSGPPFTGASPTSNIYSLKVVRSDGTSYAGDVLAAADWIYTHSFSNNIRVANFSLRSSFPDYASYDPIDAAVRRLWLSGVVVVASAGNNGNGRMLYAPASDPFVITVGASDIADTVTRQDDSNAPWTSYGYTPEGFAKPEVAAPGRWMIAPASPTTTLGTLFPDRFVSPGYMWMSGTSFAAPVVSGIAAQILARHPGFTPDQVKGALMLTAKRAPLAAPLSLGTGEVDAAAAAAVSNPPNPNANLYRFVKPDADGNPAFDWDGWNAYVSANASWTNASWTDASWTDASWTDASWTDASWTNASWTDASWTDASWTDASWTNASWTDASWTNASWTDASWTDAAPGE
jgi:serine protease AprX